MSEIVKEESVLNVLMYLFQNHMKENCELDSNAHHIVSALEEAGFESNLIDEAISWLEMLVKEDAKLINKPEIASTRVFSDEEKDMISPDCLSFIISLEQQGILNSETREIVITQVLALDADNVDISLVKWVTLMVLFNQPNSENALACMEFLVLDNTQGGVH